MRHSSQGDFAVYEFKEEDEAVEMASGRFTSRLGNKGNIGVDESAISKHTFLKAFDSRVVAEDTTCKNKEIPTVVQTCVLDEVSISSASYNMPDIVSQQMVGSQDFVPLCGKDASRIANSSSVAPDSDDDSDYELSDEQSNGMQASISSGEGGCCASGYLDHQASAECWTGFKRVGDNDMPVIVLAEYVLYGSELYAESRIIFLYDCIKMEYSDERGKEFVSEWRITDIHHISCQWSQSVGTTWVKVCLKPSIDPMQVASVHDASVMVRFCVPDFQWFDKERKILLLAPMYKDIFNTVSDTKFTEEEDVILGPKPYISKHYLIDFKESCEEIIYPKGDPDAVSISKRDFDLLQPETFVNDTIIDFYIKYLIDKIQPQEKHRFHFFNSFFFRKLVDMDKDPSGAAEGRAAFLRVRKWTRKVNIFEKDYIFIPVNFNLHWSLLVICHPGEVAHTKEESVHEACRIPCVLHMDSMKGNHTGLKDLVQSYLLEEWKERRQECLSISKFSNLRFIPLKLPQQQNSFDCGLFLLHYVELFLKDAPANFNPFRITKFSNFLNVDWFVPDEASQKRFVIRNLICDLLDGHQKGLSVGDWHGCESSKKNTENEYGEFLSSACNPTKTCNISTSSTVHDIEDNKVSNLSSFDHVVCEKEGELLHHLSEGKQRRRALDNSEQLFLRNNFHHKIRSTMSPIEEEPNGLFALGLEESPDSLVETPNKRIAIGSYSLKDVGAINIARKKDMKVDSSPDMTSCSSDNSVGHDSTEMNVDNYQQDGDTDDASCQEREKEKERTPGNHMETQESLLLAARDVLGTCDVEDSQKVNPLLGTAYCNTTSSACCSETADSSMEVGVLDDKPGDEETELLPDDVMPEFQQQKRPKLKHESRE